MILLPTVTNPIPGEIFGVAYQEGSVYIIVTSDEEPKGLYRIDLEQCNYKIQPGDYYIYHVDTYELFWTPKRFPGNGRILKAITTIPQMVALTRTK